MLRALEDMLAGNLTRESQSFAGTVLLIMLAMLVFPAVTSFRGPHRLHICAKWIALLLWCLWGAACALSRARFLQPLLEQGMTYVDIWDLYGNDLGYVEIGMFGGMLAAIAVIDTLLRYYKNSRKQSQVEPL